MAVDSFSDLRSNNNNNKKKRFKVLSGFNQSQNPCFIFYNVHISGLEMFAK